MQDYKAPRKILVAIDMSESGMANKLLSYALGTIHPEGEIKVVNVMDVNLNSAMIDRFSEVKNDYIKATQDRIATLLASSFPETMNRSISVRSGRTYVEILSAAREMGAELILIGAYRPVMSDYLLGNTATKVVQHAICSVTVIR